LVLVFQDLHWADPTTLQVLRAIAERGALAAPQSCRYRPTRRRDRDLTFAPVRLANLTAIRLGTNLIKPGGPDSNFWITYGQRTNSTG
jgi:predicted ATPase